MINNETKKETPVFDLTTHKKAFNWLANNPELNYGNAITSLYISKEISYETYAICQPVTGFGIENSYTFKTCEIYDKEMREIHKKEHFLTNGIICGIYCPFNIPDEYRTTNHIDFCPTIFFELSKEQHRLKFLLELKNRFTYWDDAYFQKMYATKESKDDLDKEINLARFRIKYLCKSVANLPIKENVQTI